MLDLGALLRVPFIESEMGFDVSPDGKKVAFSWNPEGRWEIFELALDGPSEPRQLSRGPGGKFHPRYAPDGRHLAFMTDFDGGENFHLYLYEFARDRQRDLTPGISCALQAFFSWSHDGQQIAYLSDVSGQFNTYVRSIGGEGEDPLVLDAGHPGWKVRWSPDGHWLAVTAEASGVDFNTYIVPAKGGKAICLSADGRPINAKDAAWSPDSKRLAFSSDVHGQFDIGIYDLAGKTITWLTSGKDQKQYPAWSPDGRRLAYVLNRGTLTWLAIQAPGEARLLYQVEPGVHYLPRFLDNQRLLFVFDNPRHPSDLWILSPDGSTTQLTHSMPPELAAADFVLPREITYPSVDGSPVPALLFQPSAVKPGPAAIVVHGGPDWFFEATWYPFMAHLASRGWTVLAPNYRGSTGYGRDWQLASRFDYGGVDTDDVAAGAKYLVQNKMADPKRIGVTGRSHGGYLTACCLTRYPELWVVGSAVVPFLNWFTNHDEIRPDLKHWDIENFGDPVEFHDRWHDHSPSFFLDRVRAPLQLICCGQDARCPVSDSVAARDTLESLGRVVDFVLYEDEGHTFLKMENLVESETRRVAFLAKYLED
jgi:dipeptidyl aminopeptidase/acylaminoacyl peptidase